MYFKRGMFLIAAVVVTLCYSQASAEITLKKSFFTRWKYSIDGVEFKRVGAGFELLKMMQGNREALTYMRKYNDAEKLAVLAGLTGGLLIGWSTVGYLGNGREWKDDYSTLIGIGIPLTVISIVFESSATRNLKKAVALYNDDDQSLGFMLNVKPHEEGEQITPLFRLKYEF